MRCIHEDLSILQSLRSHGFSKSLNWYYAELFPSWSCLSFLACSCKTGLAHHCAVVLAKLSSFDAFSCQIIVMDCDIKEWQLYKGNSSGVMLDMAPILSWHGMMLAPSTVPFIIVLEKNNSKNYTCHLTKNFILLHQTLCMLCDSTKTCALHAMHQHCTSLSYTNTQETPALNDSTQPDHKSWCNHRLHLNRQDKNPVFSYQQTIQIFFFSKLLNV